MKDSPKALVSLVRAHGQDRPAGRIVVGVVGRVAVLVHDPAGGNLLAAVAGQADLAGGDGGGRHVQQHLTGQVAGHANADGVCAQPAGAAAEGSHGLGAGAGVRGEQGDHALLGADVG